MRTPIALCVLSLLFLAGCQRTDSAGSDGLRRSGRYAGVGLYPAGRMWRQLRQAHASQDPAAARLADDEEIIVAIDSRTGDLRQCGNLSGYCIAINPWGRTPGSSGTAAVAKHADELDREDAEANAPAPAAPAAPPR